MGVSGRRITWVLCFCTRLCESAEVFWFQTVGRNYSSGNFQFPSKVHLDLAIAELSDTATQSIPSPWPPGGVELSFTGRPTAMQWGIKLANSDNQWSIVSASWRSLPLKVGSRYQYFIVASPGMLSRWVNSQSDNCWNRRSVCCSWIIHLPLLQPRGDLPPQEELGI